MVITILAEPRSGSTNLTNWFYLNKNFTTLFIPSDPKSKWYKLESPKDYKYNTQHLLIKEDYYHYKNFNDVLDISDKVILLYRENEAEQIESFVNAIQFKNWDKQYVYRDIKENVFDSNRAYFKKIKEEFKERYLSKDYFRISYEELYYGDGFQRIVDYLDLECVKNENFPYGSKYRVNDSGTKNLI
jgi:LPS sulfotransferase NodH